MLIKIVNPLVKQPISKTHWELTSEFHSIFYTSDGAYHCKLGKGWVTDMRSGSSLVDLIIPKQGNSIYNAVILFHDACYSGWFSKKLSDELFYKGLLYAGISKARAKMALQGVKSFGWLGYYDLEDELPSPYQNNRELEKLTLEAK